MGYHEHKRLEKENIGCAVLVTLTAAPKRLMNQEN